MRLFCCCLDTQVGKYVPLSAKRFVRVAEGAPGTASPADGLTVEVAGVAGETVELCAAYGGDGGGAMLQKVCTKGTFAKSLMNVTFVRPA